MPRAPKFLIKTSVFNSELKLELYLIWQQQQQQPQQQQQDERRAN